MGVLSRGVTGGSGMPESRRARLPVRAGGSALTILATPSSARVLRALAEGPKPLERLREAAGSPPQEALRDSLRTLRRIGLLRRWERGDARATVIYDLDVPGQELLRVGDTLERWLAASPGGGLELGSDAAAAAVRALVESWAAYIVRSVASRPFSAAEMAQLIPALTPPVLERCLDALRGLGLLTQVEAEGEPPGFAPTPWLRRSVAPLAIAARWEGRHLRTATASIDRHDVETSFLLAVPLLRLRAERSGRARLAVELRDATGDPTAVGALVEVREGEIVSCATRLGGAAGAWAQGTPRAWLLAVIEGDLSALQLAGDEDFVTDLVWAIHTELFSSPARA